MNTPVLLITYKRPELLERQLDILRSNGVKDVYIFQDGYPNPEAVIKSKESAEYLKWRELRNYLNDTDPDFKILKGFHSVEYNLPNENLGCKMGVYSAMKWFFENVEKGIILEDDVMPNDFFFEFCEDMLDYYDSDTRIFTVNGCSFNKVPATHNGYYLSKLTHSWGFATWKRVFDKFDIEMQSYGIAKGIHRHLFRDMDFTCKWDKWLNQTYNGKVNTWDFQWQYNLWLKNGLAVSPDKNLISNVGFGAGAEHTKKADSKFANMPTGPLSWERTAGLTWHQAADGMEIEQCF